VRRIRAGALGRLRGAGKLSHGGEAAAVRRPCGGAASLGAAHGEGPSPRCRGATARQLALMRCWFVPIELMAAVPQSCLSPACLPPFSVRCTAASWYLGNWTAPKLRPEGHLKPKDGHQKAHKCEDHTLNRLWNGSLFPVSELKQERRKVSSCPTLTGSVFLRQLKFFATQYMLANNC